MLEFLNSSSSVLVCIYLIFGLLLGSFLNVVIYRFPKMMEREWLSECREMLDDKSPVNESIFNLSVPRSACPQCAHQIRWFENIPILSYVFLAGKCSSCGAKIGIRYPCVELITGLLFAWCGFMYGAEWASVAWCFFSALLLALTFIDWDTQLLPDDFTYSLLWGGLLASALDWTGVSVINAIFGALAGYLSLWFITKIFYLLTGKQGMGNGDFKLYAALGVWFGWQALVPIILMASLAGAVIGIGLKIMRKEGMDVPMPFGPFLAIAGFVMMLLGVAPVLNGIAMVLG